MSQHPGGAESVPLSRYRLTGRPTLRYGYAVSWPSVRGEIGWCAPVPDPFRVMVPSAAAQQ
jgi:hypothetical protein